MKNRAVILVLYGVAATALGHFTMAADLALQQLNHREYSAAEGAPSYITALAQTADGMLWIGGFSGITRFDGARFIQYPVSGEEPLPGSNVAALLVAPDATVWVSFRPTGVAALKDGHVRSYGEVDGVPAGTVAQFAAALDGSVLAVSRSGVIQFRDDRWTRVQDPRFGVPYGVVVDAAGTIWLATSKGLFARAVGEQMYRQVDNRVYDSPYGVPLVVDANRSLWGASSKGLVQIIGSETSAVLTKGVSISGGPLLLDSASNLWAWDAKRQTVLKISSSVRSDSGMQSVPDAEQMTLNSGSNLERPFSLFEDREKNLWIGTTSGLHRFSASSIVRDYFAPTCLQELRSAGTYAAADPSGLWIACNDGRATYLDLVRDGAVISRQVAPVFTASYRDVSGRQWFAGPTALGYLNDGHLVASPLPLELQGRPIQAMMRAGDGAFWLAINRRGTYRLLNGQWSENGGLDLPHSYAMTEVADRKGVLWFGYTANRVARLADGAVRLYTAADGINIGNVLAVLPTDGQVWVGGELGLGRLERDHFIPVLDAAGAAFTGVSSIIRTRDGELWLSASSGITRIPRGEVDKVIRDPSHRVQHETFNYLDGVPGIAYLGHAQPAGLEAPDGRLWFAMTGGIVSIDPAHLVRSALPPPVSIWGLSSGTEHFGRSAAVELPVHTTDVQIDYSAGSLTVPERVRFRYRLLGLDRAWRDVGTTREARYTNLGPGHYVFQVVASNNDGVWSDRAATLTFSILPAFYQTGWFYALCTLAGVGVLGALHRMRTQRVAARVRERLEARLGERERIARDLHDTLLQGVQGLIWCFQAATDQIPKEEPARELMEQSLDRADRLLGESRDRVKGLRSAERQLPDLAEVLASEGAQLTRIQPAAFRVSAEGTARELHPLVREELLLIAREAIGNAFRHAQAGHIEVEILYGEDALRVRVRDDGRGIGEGVLEQGGKPGHFGLIGMRERAKKFGAQLTIWSKVGAGTEIELKIPRRIAYQKPDRRSHAARLWRRHTRTVAAPTEEVKQDLERI